MNSRIMLIIVGVSVIAWGLSLSGSVLLTDTQGDAIVGGQCNNTANAHCEDVCSCNSLNPSHTTNIPCVGVGQICVDCSNGGARSSVCVATGGPGCTMFGTALDCGHEVFGYCQASGDCSDVVPDENKPCADQPTCCEPN